MTEPEWWQRAKALELDGQLKEAEAAIRNAVPHLGAFSSVAQLYLERMVRLQQAGDTAGAAAAYEESSNWIYAYAGLATSGGEGAALSLQRDDFLKELGSLFRGKR
jgi:hypothetical protein